MPLKNIFTTERQKHQYLVLISFAIHILLIINYELFIKRLLIEKRRKNLFIFLL
jgi:hypothetical protein